MKIAATGIAAMLIFTGCAKQGSPSPVTSTLPVLSIANVSQLRAATASPLNVTVSLQAPVQQDVSVAYTTVDGTAVAGKDYTASSGTITIPAGSYSASAAVQISGDSLRRADQYFYVQYSGPKNATLPAVSKANCIIVNRNLLYLPVDTTGYRTPAQYAGYTLAWSDEFDGNTINTSNWGFEQGNNNGWGNQELEYYTNSTNNAFVSQGNLIIEARHEITNGFNYSSTRMLTKGKQSFAYGRIDMRAKMPTGQGIWPALWLLGQNIDTVGWPTCGEIDVLEMLGQQPNKIYGSMHWGASPATEGNASTAFTLSSGSFDQQFHVYSLTWDADSLRILVDDKAYSTLAMNGVSPNPFNNKFFLIFNIAVGGSWPGPPDGTTQFPQRMVVDYVRVFEK